MDIMVYSPFWTDYSKKNVKQFNSNFRQKFHTQPLEKALHGRVMILHFIS